MTLGERLRETTQRLMPVSDNARAEAEILVGYALGLSRSALLARQRECPDWPEAVDRLLRRREQGEPLAYVTGTQGFWTLDLQVSPDVLVPRPDTETLVEVGLECLRSRRMAPGEKVVDLGTGSACVALAIASERPDVEVWATDNSTAALEVARSNAQHFPDGQLTFVLGDWFEALDARLKRRCALILSNPPYIAEGDPHLPALRYEPRQALVSGPDGLDAIRHIVDESPRWLADAGWLALEHGFEQGQAVRDLMHARGYVEVSTRRDLGGNDRVTCGRLP